MGYFSNGSEGLDYQENYCNKCAHDVNKDCPVWLAQLTFNSEAANNDSHILHYFIPLETVMVKVGNRELPLTVNGQCKMFVKKD